MTLHLCNNGYVGLHAWEQPLDQTIHMTGVSIVRLHEVCGRVLLSVLLTFSILVGSPCYHIDRDTVRTSLFPRRSQPSASMYPPKTDSKCSWHRGTLLAKLALCIFYYRLIIGRWYRYSIFFTGALTILCFGITFFVNMFACHPIAASWNLRLTTGSSCISRSPFYGEFPVDFASRRHDV